MTFRASYAGQCADCAGQIRPGDTVTYNRRHDLVHAHCPATVDEQALRLPVCPRCFCRHAGEC